MKNRRQSRSLPRALGAALLVVASAALAGADLVPEKMRVAVVAAPNAKREFDGALSQLKWASDVYENSAAGWSKLAKRLDKTDVVLAHRAMEGLDGALATNILDFVKAGGALVVTDIAALPVEAASRDWMPTLSPGIAPTVAPFDAEKTKPVTRVGVERTLLSHPNPADSPAEGVGPVFKADGRHWEVAGKVRGQPCVLLRRTGKGFIVLSTARYNDRAFLGNVGHALALSRLGVAFGKLAYEFPRDVRTAEFTFGKGSIKIDLANTSGTNLLLRAVAEWKAGTESRTVSRVVNQKNQGNFSVALGTYLDLRGEGAYTVTLENLDTGATVVLAEKPFSCQKFLTVIPPVSFHGLISTARRDPAVHFEVLLSPFQSQSVAGLEVEASVKDAKGTVLGVAKRVANAAGYLDFAIPLPDAPPGTYTLSAKTVRDGIFEERDEATFKIVPVRPGQMLVDQDGTLLADGKPFFPIATYHAHSWQLEDDVEGLATNKYGAKGWHDMGFNMITIWPWDYYANVSTNAADILAFKAGEGAATNLAWFVEKNAKTLARYRELGIRLLLEDGPWGEIVRGGSGAVWEADAANNTRRRRFIDAPERLFAGLYDFDEAHDAPNVIQGQQRWSDRLHSQTEDYPTVGLGRMGMAWTCDIPGCEVYPVYGGGNGPLTPVGETLDAYLAFTRGKKNIPLIHQCFGDNPRGASETPAQVRAMTYLGYTHGAKGIFWYCWKQTGDWSGAQGQGMGWHPETYTEVRKLVSETKVFCQALLEPGARKFKSTDGKIHAILCGSEQTGRFLVYVNPEYEAVESELLVPELDGVAIAPLFGGPKAAVKKGRLSLKVPALGTGAFLVGHDPSKPLPENCVPVYPEWVLTGKFPAPPKAAAASTSEAFAAILLGIADPAKEADSAARLLKALKDFVPKPDEAGAVVESVCAELTRLGKKDLLATVADTVAALQYGASPEVAEVLARYRK